MYPLPTSSEVPLSGSTDRLPPLPDFEEDERLMVIVSELSLYFVEAIETPHTFEQLKTTSAGHRLKPLIRSLTDTCHHSGIVTALLILKWHFSSLEHDDRQINETRGYACEFVAWRLLTRRPQHELIDCLLSDIPGSSDGPEHSSDVEAGDNTGGGAEENLNPDVVDERTTLLCDRRLSPKTRPKLRTTNLQNESSGARNEVPYSTDEDLTLSFVGSNALEIAAIARAKSFFSQRVVQKIVDGIWSGDIVFWESLSLYSKKKAHVYNKRRVDPYSRLRIPKYQKLFEALFFVMFLALYYAVLVERNPQKITFVEVFLYIWIAAFAYNEYGEFQDSGTLFYAMDFWSIWDVGIVGIGAAYLIARVVGLIKNSRKITDTSFDILSLEALFLVPRVCSLLSLHPYFGTLVVVLAFSDLRGAQADDVWQIPCLKEMVWTAERPAIYEYVKLTSLAGN
ncbi:hypothetical protein MMC22_008868 [Lobaria immixta]|nr:hypothetical protein [Lobaria immixta]